jgi:hypothetical protein
MLSRSAVDSASSNGRAALTAFVTGSSNGRPTERSAIARFASRSGSRARPANSSGTPIRAIPA